MISILDQNEFSFTYLSLYKSEIKHIEIKTQLKRYILGMISGILINPSLLSFIISNFERLKNYVSSNESYSEDEEWDEYEYMEELSPSLKINEIEYFKETLQFINSKDKIYYNNMIENLSYEEYDKLNKILN